MSAPRQNRAIYLGDFEILTELHSGHRIYVDSRDVGIAAHLMWYGQWETWVESVLIQRVLPGMRVLDVGANFGYYTLQMAQCVGSEGLVIAVEANPSIAAKLKKSVAVNGLASWTKVHQVAVATEVGERSFRFDPNFSGGGRFGSALDSAIEIVSVATAPLDAIVPDDFEAEVIKMDVEGAEGLVLLGGARTFASPKLRCVVSEFSPGAIREFMAPLEFLRYFTERGFSLQLIEQSGLQRVDAEQLARGDIGEVNYVLFERQVG